MNGMERIRFVNHDGGGFSEDVLVPTGTTIGSFFSSYMTGKSPQHYAIRVNEAAVKSDHVLRSGDRVTITPNKVAGA